MEKREELIAEITKVYDYYNGLSAQLAELEQEPGKEVGEEKSSLPYHSIVKCKAQIEKLELENKSGQKEISFLKDLLRRCNDKLNRYIHTKDGSESEVRFGAGEDDDDEEEERDREASLALPRKSVYQLRALLLAYDETSIEQEAAIRRLTSAVERLYKQLKVLADENDRFHAYVDTFNHKVSSDGDVGERVEDIALVLEENSLLGEEREALREKERTKEEEYTHQVSNLEGQLSAVSAQLEAARSEVDALKEELTCVKAHAEGRVSEQEHAYAVQQCAKYLSVLKGRYGAETGRLKRTNATLRASVEKTRKEASGARREVKGCRDAVRRTSSQLSRHHSAVKLLKASNRALRIRLRHVTRICSRLLEDRLELSQDLRRLTRETLRHSQSAKEANAKLGKLTARLKEERVQTSLALSSSEGKAAAMEAAWRKALREGGRMRSMVASKEEALRAVLAQLRFVSNRQQ